MTTITIRRAEMVEDDYGDPQPGVWSDWKTFEGLVGWSNPDEPLEVGRNTVITNRTVYIRGTEPTGILSSDRAVIGGVEYEIDGSVAEWVADEYAGAQFAVKVAG